MKHTQPKRVFVWIASLLALLLVTGIGCGDADDIMLQPDDDRGSAKAGEVQGDGDRDVDDPGLQSPQPGNTSVVGSTPQPPPGNDSTIVGRVPGHGYATVVDSTSSPGNTSTPADEAPGYGDTSGDDSTPQSGNDSTTADGALGNGDCLTIDHDVVINTRAELQRFDRYDCFRIEGHLFIRETAGIENLDALHGLREVTGYVGIARNQKLNSVSLPKLENVGEGLVIEGNLELKTISIPELEDVGGYLHVFNNPELTDASFAYLEKVGDDVIFAGNNALVKLELPCLNWIGGTFIFEHSITLEFLCLPQLRYVGDSFIVHFNRGLRALLVPNLTHVGQDLEIERNPELVMVDMDRLIKVGGNLKVVHNFKWSRCQVLEILAHLEGFVGTQIIHDNYAVCRVVDIEVPPWCSTDACEPVEPACYLKNSISVTADQLDLDPSNNQSEVEIAVCAPGD